jgi:hypothetical protein
MSQWTFYPAFFGTFISIISWTYLTKKEHLKHIPRTLSEIASEKPESLRYYRIILWVCGPLFALTTLLYIVPRIANPVFVGLVSSITILSEMLLGIFTAKRGKVTIHDLIANLMGLMMIASAFVFALGLKGTYRYTESGVGLTLSILAILTIVDSRRYIFYELPFIYLAHISVLVAAIALR